MEMYAFKYSSHYYIVTATSVEDAIEIVNNNIELRRLLTEDDLVDADDVFLELPT